MGIRLSLKVLPKYVAKKIWLATEYEDIISKELEPIVSDFCTDAMFDVLGDKEQSKKLKRLTKNKLSIECDVWLGKMDKECFMAFLNKVKYYAERQIKSGDPLCYWECHHECENPWMLFNSIDWISAYYECWFILKKMDWENNYIYCELG